MSNQTIDGVPLHWADIELAVAMNEPGRSLCSQRLSFTYKALLIQYSNHGQHQSFEVRIRILISRVYFLFKNKPVCRRKIS